VLRAGVGVGARRYWPSFGGTQIIIRLFQDNRILPPRIMDLKRIVKKEFGTGGAGSTAVHDPEGRFITVLTFPFGLAGMKV
jgi:hypothetical protein